MVIAFLLMGCSNPNDSYGDVFIKESGNLDMYLVSGSVPLLYFTDYEQGFSFPLLRNTKIISNWDYEGINLFSFDETGRALGVSPMGTMFDGTYQWVYTNAVIVRYEYANGIKLDEPFDQWIYIDWVDDCHAEFNVYTFGIKTVNVLNRCQGNPI